MTESVLADTIPPASPRRVLGVSAGRAGGSPEILLKAALREIDLTGAHVELVRLEDLALPLAPGDADDTPWYWERLLAADGVIFSSPINSRTVAARLKVLSDRLLGPNADAAIIEDTLRRQRAGENVTVPFRVDERVLRPRVGAFLSVGGSLTDQWQMLSLPILHTQTLSMSIAVVDQVEFQGAGMPRSIVLDSAAMERAAQLGRHVAAQLGRGLDDAEYLGPQGLCPVCHLDIIRLRVRDVRCATCGARGELAPTGEVRWTDLSTSALTMTERRAHAREIQDIGAAQAARADEIATLATPWDAYDRRVTPTHEFQDVAR